MNKSFFLLLFTFLVTAEGISQGFNSANGRNHPELNWQVAETEHFLIMYPDRIAGIEAEAASIAEESYRALSENMNVEFDRKVRIYLTDEDEIVNGFAVPFRNFYTNMWVNLNDYGENFTSEVKWLRKVLAHELGHIFHYRAIWSNMGMYQAFVGEPIARFWTEGLAQYQTEKWDSQRGDRWLRKAIFDSRPGYEDGQSFENGRLMYASGNSQLRYFTEKYGDSTLVDLLSHRDTLLGSLEYHDFYPAFDEVVDGGYRSFYDEWRKHMNVYYNTLASTMERVDSLGGDQLSIPGEQLLDMALSPDGLQIAVLTRTSVERPVKRLHIMQNDSTRKTELAAEGAINTDLSWSSDGQSLYYSRLVRGEYSSLVNDLFVLNLALKREKRITYSRKARFPVESHEENRITYIVNENGTGNLFRRNPETGDERRITNYTDDIQLLWPVRIPGEDNYLVQKSDTDGSRKLVLISGADGSETVLIDNGFDNRNPVLSPDGKSVAYTSLRDEVPNVFVYNFEDNTETRKTNLFTGGEVYGWLAETDSLEGEQFLVSASETNRRDSMHRIPVERSVYRTDSIVPRSYSTWRQKSPPVQIPFQIEPDAALITDRYSYRSFKNLSHVVSLALPYYSGSDDWGLFGLTAWSEPLGKHAITGFGSLSAGNVSDNSYGALSYQNNQLYPTLLFSIYRMPDNPRFYGDEFLVEDLSGGDIQIRIPLDALDAPYQSSQIGLKLRHVLIRPYNTGRFGDTFTLPQPESGRQTDLKAGWILKKQRPWKDNIIHPLDGYGIRAELTGAEKILGSDVRFLTADLNTYRIFPSVGLHRIYANVRLQAQWGDPFPQSFIGFSRYDNIDLNLPGEIPFRFFNQADRVRGYRSYVAGRQVTFGSVEYRMPFLSSLNTSILGMLELGSASLSLFSDAGIVWDARRPDGSRSRETRLGAGAELKNHLSLFGIGFSHAAGIARPAEELFSDGDYDLYYRVQAVVPF